MSTRTSPVLGVVRRFVISVLVAAYTYATVRLFGTVWYNWLDRYNWSPPEHLWQLQDNMDTDDYLILCILGIVAAACFTLLLCLLLSWIKWIADGRNVSDDSACECSCHDSSEPPAVTKTVDTNEDDRLR